MEFAQAVLNSPIDNVGENKMGAKIVLYTVGKGYFFIIRKTTTVTSDACDVKDLGL